MNETETIAGKIYWNRIWHWNKYLGERKGQRCRILATGRMNSALIEFEDGYKVLSSRYAVRKGRESPKHEFMR